jgi:predicted nucleic-acid-binding protein
VLAEAIWVLDARYERTAEQIATAVEMLLNHKNLTLQDADVGDVPWRMPRPASWKFQTEGIE